MGTINVNKSIFNSEQLFQIEKIVEEKISNFLPIIEVVQYENLTKEERENSIEAEKEFLEGKTKSFEEIYKKCMK